jgi:hypothetical protein
MEKINELKNLLHNGVVEFTYTKKNGELRTARGTLNFDEIPEDQHPRGGDVDYSSETTTRYYDLNSSGWRSFINENLVEIL